LKTVYILRHAKSSWSNPGLADIERPLNKRGKKDAPLMANVMKRFNYFPEMIILSPSVRTQATVKPIVKTLKLKEYQLEIDESLYHGYYDNYEEIIRQLDPELKSVMLVGHNPGITFIANSCTGPILDNVPTCGLLVIQSEIEDWKSFSFSESTLVKYHFPKMYK
jgi:phosphohistidine phosphatase